MPNHASEGYLILSGRSPYYSVFFRHPNAPGKFTVNLVGDGFEVACKEALYTSLEEAIKDCDAVWAAIPMPNEYTFIRVIQLPLQIDPEPDIHGFKNFYNPDLTRVYTPAK